MKTLIISTPDDGAMDRYIAPRMAQPFSFCVDGDGSLIKQLDDYAIWGQTTGHDPVHWLRSSTQLSTDAYYLAALLCRDDCWNMERLRQQQHILAILFVHATHMCADLRFVKQALHDSPRQALVEAAEADYMDRDVAIYVRREVSQLLKASDKHLLELFIRVAFTLDSLDFVAHTDQLPKRIVYPFVGQKTSAGLRMTLGMLPDDYTVFLHHFPYPLPDYTHNIIGVLPPSPIVSRIHKHYDEVLIFDERAADMLGFALDEHEYLSIRGEDKRIMEVA